MQINTMKQLACILIALAVVGVYGDEPDKLVNGIPTKIENYPHCISMRNYGSHMCGGSIIDKQYVLTAAHCLVSLIQNPLSKRTVTVVAGTTYLNQGGQSYKIANMWVHESYDPNDPTGRGPYDIGLIKLATPIQFSSSAQAIKLPSRDIAANDAVTIAAWGSTGYGRPIHNDLQKLSSKAMPPNICQEYHKGVMRVHQTNEFCTLIAKGTGLCHGDSGSGLIRDSDRTLVGLVSGGRPCATGYPDVYTNVFPYIFWLREKMAE